ncbi:unnamed protein product [Amoebophrya sp. A25]|nr:unnamed protein product [Amoebophrya sp. A25]|eukprot:GSA25T00000783001.1
MLALRFTHDSVSDSFRPFSAHGPATGSIIEEKNRRVLDSMREIVEREFAKRRQLPRDLDVLDVCFHEGDVYLAGTGNRRLTMWRMLALAAPENFGVIKVRLVNRDDPKIRFFEKLTAVYSGRWVEAINVSASSQHVFVGRCRDAGTGWHKGVKSRQEDGVNATHKPAVQWPEAQTIMRKMGENMKALHTESALNARGLFIS